MYISEKAVHQTTVSSSGDSEAVAEESEDTSVRVKTKLRATQSLPVMRKYWKRDLTSEESVKGLINTLNKMNSVKSLPSLDKEYDDISDTSNLDDFLTNCQIELKNDTSSGNAQNTDKLQTGSQNIKNVPQDTMCFSFGKLDLKVDKSGRVVPISLSDIDLESAEGKVTDNQVPHAPTAPSMRGNLTRQTTIFCQKSSVDSSSVKTDHSSDDKASTDQSSESKSNQFCSFRRLYINSDEENKAVAKNEITVIIPKAKIDKYTQVAQHDITRETGWDLIEGVYLLLRKISIKLPCQTDNVRKISVPTSLSLESNFVGTNGKSSSENVLLDKNRLQVPHSPRDERDYPPRRPCTGTEKKADYDLPGHHLLLRDESHRNVNAWFERNSLLNSPNRLAPVRQYTIETVDSGFDDSLYWSNCNRQGRLSLPNVLSGKTTSIQFIYEYNFSYILKEVDSLKNRNTIYIKC